MDAGIPRDMKKANRDHQKVLEEALDCISRLHAREMQARTEASETARIKKSFAYRLGKLLVSHGRSPIGWLRAPMALWRELHTQRRYNAAAAARAGMPEPLPGTTIRLDTGFMWVPLADHPQPVVASCGDGRKDLWVTPLSARAGGRIALAAKVRGLEPDSGIDGRATDQVSRHKDLVIRRFELRSGVPSRLLDGATGDISLELFRERGGFCVLKIELGESGVEPQGLSGLGSPPGKHLRRPLPGETRQFSADDLEQKLWGGFARYAIPALEQLKNDDRAPISERQAASWYLARWFYVDEDYQRALDCTEYARRLDPKRLAHLILTEAQCLIRLGHYARADAILADATRDDKPDFQILRSSVVRHRRRESGASAEEAEDAQLDLLNGVYVAAGLAPIRKKRGEDPLHISNITAAARSNRREQHLKVSVVVPAYNAEKTVSWVLDSLLVQTWRNLEVIVVNDCSTDGTAEVVTAIARRDARVSLVNLQTNGGAYAARNEGVRHASGDLITVHDSDDWSHPQRIELQVNALESRRDIVATKSHWVRVTEDLDIIGSWRPKGSIFDLNFSSLLFRRELLDIVGPWDEVLVSADAEFYSRLKRLFGDNAILKLPNSQLLAFSLARESSLTRTGRTHVRSLDYGLRGNYRHSYRYWHSQLMGPGQDLPYDPRHGRRSFPVPPLMLSPHRRRAATYDVVVISDLAMRGGAFISTLNYLIAACKSGKRAAVFHWRRFDLATDVPLQPLLYEACLEFDVDILGPEDDVDTDIVLIGYPPILQHRIEPIPAIRAERVAVIVNQYASRLVDGGDEQYDPLRARKHLKEIFGTEGIWVPISTWVKRLLEEDDRYPDPYPIPWHPMIDVGSWCTEPLRWRGTEHHVPVVGRHGRDTYTKWLSDPAELASAYGVGQVWDVRFLGGADWAIEILGRRPANWTIVKYDDISAKEFLTDLDFYVHYPHERYIEEFGRAVMEAMALGIPAVLPPVFRQTFGDAATYAEPAEVPKVISEIWASQDRYRERAEAARRFVLEQCSLATFPERLEALKAITPVAGAESAPSAADRSAAAGL